MTKRFILPLLTAALLLGSYLPVSAQDVEKTCDEWRCEFQAALAQECDCESAANHGRYVSCVAHQVKLLVEQGLPKNCKGKLKRCAARSICGKQSRDFHTCTSTIAGDCDEATYVCFNDTSRVCLVDADCDETKCRIRRGDCKDELALVDVSPSCCSTCATPAPN